MTFVDTHCHLDFPDFEKDLDAVLERGRHAGIQAFIDVGASLKGCHGALRLARQYPQIFAAAGIHPHDAKTCDQTVFDTIRSMLEEDKVVAVGEVGLDFYRTLSDPSQQIKVFKDFIGLALEYDKPLIVHSRRAEDQTMEILKAYAGCGLRKVVVHCFSGTQDFLLKCLDLGFFISVTANITYPKADTIRDLIPLIPMDRLMLETDAPFLADQTHRGQRNEPAFLVETAQCIASITRLSLEDVSRITTKNARLFFNLPD